MKTVLRSAFALGLLFTAASCSSDSKSSDKTTASAAATTVASSAASADSTATTTAGSTADSTAASSSSGGSLQDQVADQALEEASKDGFTFDETCLRTAVAALTDADAQAILDAGVTGDPDVSAAGKAVATAIGACIQVSETTATSGS